MVPFENYRERIGITRLKMLHYALVIKREKFSIRHAVVAVAGTCTYETHRASWPLVYTTESTKDHAPNLFSPVGQGDRPRGIPEIAISR